MEKEFVIGGMLKNLLAKTPQQLTDEEKAQILANLGITPEPGSLDGAVLYNAIQVLTAAQKKKARENIGAMSEAELSLYAKINGYYSQLTAGAAENLVGGNDTSREFTRDTAGGTADIADGIVKIDRIKGNTIVWNQLVGNETAEVETTSGHKYRFADSTNSTDTIITSTGQTLSVVGGTDMVFDLTKMFGAGNEPATVAEFEKMFPLDYYDYNEGEFLSLNPSGIKTVGFNAYNPSTGKASVIGGKQYQITGAYTSIAEGDTTITPDSDGFFTPTHNGELTITGGNSTTTCVHLVWSGKRNGKYEEHWEETRNIPVAKINTDGTITESDAGKTRLFPDGLCSAGTAYDEVTTTKAIKRIGKVDLWTLSWQRVSSTGGFYTFDNTTLDYRRLSGYLSNAICIKYNVVEKSKANILDKEISLRNDGRVYIRDDSYSTVEAFKAAMSGVYLYYELATPVEVTFARPINLNYKVSDLGTETLLPINTATPVTAPIRLDVVYGLNVVDFVRNADKNYLTIEDSTGDNGSSFTNLRSALSTAFGIDIVPTYDSTNKRYTFAISDNRKVEVPESVTSSGTKGTWAEDSTSVYFCTDTNVWVKLSKTDW